MDWQGRTVLIAGGAGGMGMATAAEFVKAGANIAIADFKIQQLPENYLGISFDITEVCDSENMVKACVARFGRLDVLINAAGVWVEGESAAMTEAQWDRTLNINLKGTFFTCHYAIPELAKTEGQIINSASDADRMGIVPGLPSPAPPVEAWRCSPRPWRWNWPPRGIRVNAICPCNVETPMLDFQAMQYGASSPESCVEKLRSIYPQGARQRFARPAEIASSIFTIASPELSPITGAALPIDLGTTVER
jgi:NAD(P)-dependent dehydrogenase (short-subunit alcohol dehydrogenase family)